ncbi:MAG: hypothetical protein RLZZ618_3282 [Pseudomonadota bacterium]|jgi:hypothetical protein
MTFVSRWTLHLSVALALGLLSAGRAASEPRPDKTLQAVVALDKWVAALAVDPKMKALENTRAGDDLFEVLFSFNRDVFELWNQLPMTIFWLKLRPIDPMNLKLEFATVDEKIGQIQSRLAVVGPMLESHGMKGPKEVLLLLKDALGPVTPGARHYSAGMTEADTLRHIRDIEAVMPLLRKVQLELSRLPV